MKVQDVSYPSEILEQLRSLGARVRTARIRRKLRLHDLAARAGVSRTALSAVESGAPTTGIGTYLRVLWAMGLNQEFELLADPGLDRDGLGLEISVQTKRVGVRRKVSNDF